MNTNILAAAVLLAAAATAVTTFSGSAVQAAETEMCFGVAKAGANDCKSGAHDCAGHATTDRDPASFIVVPAGTCAKLAGGSLKPAG